MLQMWMSHVTGYRLDVREEVNYRYAPVSKKSRIRRNIRAYKNFEHDMDKSIRRESQTKIQIEIVKLFLHRK